MIVCFINPFPQSISESLLFFNSAKYVAAAISQKHPEHNHHSWIYQLYSTSDVTKIPHKAAVPAASMVLSVRLELYIPITE